MDDIIEIVEITPDPVKPEPVMAASATTDKKPELPSPGFDAVYRLAPDAKTRVRTLTLPSQYWAALLKVNGKRSVQNIAEAISTTPETIAFLLDRLMLMGLVRAADAVTLQEHIKSTRETDLASNDATTTVPADTIQEDNVAPQAPTLPEAQTHLADTGPRSLYCLMQLIRKGQTRKRVTELRVYQIFTAVPRQMFLDAGINSFLFIDDETEITHPPLIQALAAETQRVLGRDISKDLKRCMAA